MKIFKYTLPNFGKFELVLPRKSTILSVKNQHETIVLYALVNPEEEKMEDRIIIIKNLGDWIDSGPFKFIGTVELGAYPTAHVFEDLRG